MIGGIKLTNSVEGENRKGNVTEKAWSQAFEAQDKAKFTEVFAEDVVLVASALAAPVVGREQVACCVSNASKYYKYCNFTHQATSENRTWLEWDLQTIDGMNMQGITVLERNEKGEVIKVGIHHRLLGEVLLFSEHLREATKGVVPEESWYTPDLYEKTRAKYPNHK